MVKSLILTSLVAGVACSIASAEQYKIDPVFAGYLNSPGYRKQLVQFLSKASPVVKIEKCDSVIFRKASLVEIVRSPKFLNMAAGGIKIDQGAWVVEETVMRCGMELRHRLFVRAEKGIDSLLLAHLLPGVFFTNLKLRTDAAIILKSTALASTGCKDPKKFKVVDVISLTPASNQGWSEKWVAKACGRQVECDVKYPPKTNALNITADKCSVK